MKGRRWGKPRKSERTEIRGQVGGEGLAKSSEITITGINGRWKYEFSLPMGRSVHSHYIFESQRAAQEEAVRFAELLLVALGVPAEEMEAS